MKYATLPFLVLLTACAGRPAEPAETSSPAPVESPEQIEPETPALTLAGHYTFGHEARTFQPCGVEEVYWITGDDALRRFHEETSGEPDAPVFAVVRLVARPPALDGFAADYDGLVEVAEVVMVRAPDEADCLRPVVVGADPPAEAHPLEEEFEACSERENWTTSGVLMCLDAAGRAWDAELNEQYQVLMGRLSPEEQQSLRHSQRQWIAFRDAESEFFSAVYGEMEGTMWRLINVELIVSITRDRALALARTNSQWN